MGQKRAPAAARRPRLPRLVPLVALARGRATQRRLPRPRVRRSRTGRRPPRAAPPRPRPRTGPSARPPALPRTARAAAASEQSGCRAGAQGKTPLHYAAENGHADAVQLLLDKCANASKQDQVSTLWLPSPFPAPAVSLSPPSPLPRTTSHARNHRPLPVQTVPIAHRCTGPHLGLAGFSRAAPTPLLGQLPSIANLC